MYAVVTPGLHAPELFNLVQLVIPIRVGQFVYTAFHLFFVIVDCDVKGVECPEKSVGRTNIGRNFFNLRLVQILSCLGGGKPVKPAELIACNDPVLVVHAKIHPRAKLFLGHGVEQFHLEAVSCGNVFDRGRLALNLSR